MAAKWWPNSTRRSVGWKSWSLSSRSAGAVQMAMRPGVQRPVSGVAVAVMGSSCRVPPADVQLLIPRTVAGLSARLRAAQVQCLAFSFEVELVPCRRRQDGPTLIVTSELTEGGTSIHDCWHRQVVQRRQGLRFYPA